MKNMRKINFQNGTTINGAQTFNKLQDNVDETLIAIGLEKPSNGERLHIKKSNNLFNPGNSIFGYLSTNGTLTSSALDRTNIIKVEPNTSYAISKTRGSRLRIGTSNNPLNFGGVVSNFVTKSGADTYIFTTDSNTNYLYIYYYDDSQDNSIGLSNIENSIMVNVGNIVLTHDTYITPQIHCNRGNGYELVIGDDKVVTGITTLTTDAIGRIVLPIPDIAKCAYAIVINNSYICFLRKLNALEKLCYVKDPDTLEAIANTEVSVNWSYLTS